MTNVYICLDLVSYSYTFLKISMRLFGCYRALSDHNVKFQFLLFSDGANDFLLVVLDILIGPI